MSAWLGHALAARSVSTTRVGTAAELLRLVEQRTGDLVVLEASLEAAEAVRRADRFCPILWIIPAVTQDLLFAAMRTGINDILPASCSRGTLEETVNRLTPLKPCNADDEWAGGPRIVGTSAAIRKVRLDIRKLAAVRSNVLITGETGTGKELAAESIHSQSTRSAQPFVSINCAALPDSLLESELFGHERGAFTGAQCARPGKLQFANGGTVFLDEIGDMDLHAQAKILRVIETRNVQRLGGNRDIPIDIRIVAATNRNLEELVAERRFRQDLYYRLNVARIHLPPLRERREDIAALLDHALEDLNRRTEKPPLVLDAALLSCLTEYAWPGNVRELRNVIESAHVFCSSRTIGRHDLPAYLGAGLGPAEPPAPEDERNRLLHALDSAEWNRTEAAKILHWSRMTLYRKMQKHAIEARPGRNTMTAAVTA
jgi:DNA-binding NtrC family response regulator